LFGNQKDDINITGRIDKEKADANDELFKVETIRENMQNMPIWKVVAY
jgi:hypothetical protein